MTRDASAWAGVGRSLHALAMSVGCSDLAMVATVVAIAGLYLVSPITLESQGIAYITAGGGLLSKVHPSTPIIFGALGLRCAASSDPLRRAWRLMTSDPGVVLLLAAVSVAAVCAVFIDHTPVTPLIDTFILPIVVFLMLRDIDPVIVRWLALILTGVMCLNAVIAIWEFLGGWHLVKIEVPDGVSADPMRSDATFDWRAQLLLEWRATALLGHPLVNGLMTGAFIICLSAPGSNWIPGKIKLALILLQFVSMFAFGARSALVFALMFAAWFGLAQAVEAIGRGARLDSRRILILCVGSAVLVGLVLVLLQTGLIDRTAARFANDQGSASTRITMFNLFQPLSTIDVLFGPDSDLVATWQRLEGLEFGIESSWVGLVLTYGLIVAALLFVGICALAFSAIRAGGRGAAAVLLFYLILISASASLSGKTTTYAMTIALVMIFLRKDEGNPSFPSAAPFKLAVDR